MKAIILIVAVFFISCEGCINVDVDGEIDHKVYIYPCLGEKDLGGDSGDSGPTCITPEELREQYF